MVEYKIQHTHNESFRGKKEKNGGKKVFDDIMTNSFSELMKGTNAQNQES